MIIALAFVGLVILGVAHWFRFRRRRGDRALSDWRRQFCGAWPRQNVQRVEHLSVSGDAVLYSCW